MQHLMIIAIGPVQEFIASARRCRDLWFGSWLLSELSRTAAYTIVTEHGHDLSRLIFPKPDTMDDLNGTNEDFSVVNKIVALVSKEPEDIGAAVYQHMLERLQAIRKDAYKQISAAFRREIAEKQVDDLIEFFWAAAPLSSPGNDQEYARARAQAESLLAARKATRDFQPAAWAASLPKSSLDGLRESVIPEHVYDHMSVQDLHMHYGVRKGERLCGVGLLKRHGNRTGDDSFFSTSHVAALPLLQILNDPQAVDEYVRKLVRLLRDVKEKDAYKILGKVPRKTGRDPHPVFGRHDGHLLFEERLSEFFEKEDLNQAQKALKKFLDRALNGRQPIPYYALLLADGDWMGKAIDAQRNAGRHRALSSSLTHFAKSVREIVEESHQGSLIYAGGDDVLAFVPLHTALQCAHALAGRFKQELLGFPTGELDKQNQPITPTLSVGVALSHHLEPLSDALQLARQAEKTAKTVEGKNALAVILSKRSGADRIVKGKWGSLDQRLDRFIVLHRTESIPDGAAYEIHDLAFRLKGVQREALCAEAMRILKRKRPARGTEKIADPVLEELSRFIHKSDIPIDQMADEMIIAQIFAKATVQAGIQAEELPGAQPQRTQEDAK